MPFPIIEINTQSIPMIKEIFTHFFALALLISASSYFPCANKELTLPAFTIPAIPKGKQQKIVTNIDSVNQVLGQVFVSIII